MQSTLIQVLAATTGRPHHGTDQALLGDVPNLPEGLLFGEIFEGMGAANQLPVEAEIEEEVLSKNNAEPVTPESSEQRSLKATDARDLPPETGATLIESEPVDQKGAPLTKASPERSRIPSIAIESNGHTLPQVQTETDQRALLPVPSPPRDMPKSPLMHLPVESNAQDLQAAPTMASLRFSVPIRIDFEPSKDQAIEGFQASSRLASATDNANVSPPVQRIASPQLVINDTSVAQPSAQQKSDKSVAKSKPLDGSVLSDRTQVTNAAKSVTSVAEQTAEIQTSEISKSRQSLENHTHTDVTKIENSSPQDRHVAKENLPQQTAPKPTQRIAARPANAEPESPQQQQNVQAKRVSQSVLPVSEEPPRVQKPLTTTTEQPATSIIRSTSKANQLTTPLPPEIPMAGQGIDNQRPAPRPHSRSVEHIAPSAHQTFTTNSIPIPARDAEPTTNNDQGPERVTRRDSFAPQPSPLPGAAAPAPKATSVSTDIQPRFSMPIDVPQPSSNRPLKADTKTLSEQATVPQPTSARLVQHSSSTPPTPISVAHTLSTASQAVTPQHSNKSAQNMTPTLDPIIKSPDPAPVFSDRQTQAAGVPQVKQTMKSVAPLPSSAAPPAPANDPPVHEPASVRLNGPIESRPTLAPVQEPHSFHALKMAAPSRPTKIAPQDQHHQGPGPDKFLTRLAPNKTVLAPMPQTRFAAPAAFQPHATFAPLNPMSPTVKENAHPADISEPASLFRAEAPTSAAPQTVPNAQRLEMPTHVARQILEVAQNLPNKPVEISLNPEELGRLRLAVSTSEAGLVVNITAERPETLDLLRRHIATLGQEFQAIGYDEIAFSFNSNPQSNDQNDAHGDAQHRNDAQDDSVPDIEVVAQNNLRTKGQTGLDLRL